MWWEGTENPAQLRVLLPHIQGTGESSGIYWLWERQEGSQHTQIKGCEWNSHGEGGNLHSQLQLWRIPENPTVTPLQTLLGKALLTEGFSLTRLHSKSRTEVLWQCVNHGNGRLSVARVICARSQDLLNPWGESKFNDWAVLETRMKHPWRIRGGWEKTQKGAWVSPPHPFRKCSFSA